MTVLRKEVKATITIVVTGGGDLKEEDMNTYVLMAERHMNMMPALMPSSGEVIGVRVHIEGGT